MTSQSNANYGYLVYQLAGQEQRYILRLGSNVIGRDTSNDLVLGIEGVSRFHARVQCAPEGCQIYDLHSSNRTILNNVPITPDTAVSLQDGDEIRLGKALLRYAAARPTAQVPAPVEQSKPIPAKQERAVPENIQPPRVPDPPGPKAEAKPHRSPPKPPAPPKQQDTTTWRYLQADQVIPSPLKLSRYMEFLPACYQAEPLNFLNRFLLIFESVLAPIERTIGQIEHHFEPRTTPYELLPWLATWVSLVLNDNWSAANRRLLIRRAAELYRLRGTRRGLSEYLTIYTGVTPQIIESWLTPLPQYASLPAYVFLVILDISDTTIDQALVEAIIDSEKPAHTSYYLEIRSAST